LQTRLNSRFQFFAILWRCLEFRFVDHGDGFFGTAGGAHGTSKTAVEIHLRHIILSHGQRLRRTPVDAGFADHAQISIKLGIEPGVEKQTRLGLGKGIFHCHAVITVAISQKPDVFGHILAHVYETGLFSPFQDISGLLLGYHPGSQPFGGILRPHTKLHAHVIG